MGAYRPLRSRFVPWLLVGVYALLISAGLVLEALTGSTAQGIPFPFHIIGALVLFIWASVGALLVSRHPDHPVGWAFLAMPILYALDHFTFGYAYYGTISHPGSLPGAKALILWQYTSGALTLIPFTFLFLLFPNGRPPSYRWWLVAPVSIMAVVSFAILATLSPERSSTVPFPFPTNPFDLSESARSLLDTPRRFLYALSFLMTVVAIFSLFYRLRRSRGIERQQIKYLVYAAAFFVPGATLVFLGELSPVLGTRSTWTAPIGVALVVVSITGIAIASAIAILRYRLFDIDIIIRRTLQYGILTGILALIYFGLVVVLQALFAAIGQVQSEILIVVSTLATAAVFSPLRNRIQRAIDRRFYRRKYHAEQVLAQFAAVARDEVDLDRLTVEMLGVVAETIQPEFVSFSLVSSERRAGKSG